jgi:hypothetical protein
MPRNSIIYRKGRLSKWILTATFLLSILSFSGYTGRAVSRPLAVQTESVFTCQQRLARRAVRFYATAAAVDSKPSNDPCQYYTNVLLISNRLTATRLRRLAKQYCSFKTACRFMQLNRVLQSHGDDYIITAIA